MSTRINLALSAIIIALSISASIVNAESKIKGADSITKDLIIEQKPAATGDSNWGATPVTRTRGIKIIPISVDQVNTGSGRTALSVEFSYDSAVLTQNAKLQLDQLAQALYSKDLNDHAFEVIGHTDATGSDEYNMGLSKRRAFSVVQYLNGTHKVRADRLYAAGRGERELADPQNPANGVNRRVEIWNLGTQ